MRETVTSNAQPWTQAEEAAECERATADELLALLKEKESEISQLRCVDNTVRVVE